MKAIVNTTLYDFNHYKENQYILFDDRIIEVGPMDKFEDKGYDLIEGSGHLTMPSLVNAHSHIYSTFARGMSVPFNPINFHELLEQLWWKLDGGLNLDNIYHSGMVYGSETLLNGVTTLIDHHASGVDIEGSLNSLKKAVCDELGLRGIFCFETSDRFETYRCINENIHFARDHQTQTSRGLFGMHAAMTLSDESLRMISKQIDGLPIHIHVAESQLDESESLIRHGQRVIERLDEFNLLKPNSLLAHCLFIDEDEAKLIKENQCKVVLNVTSNMNNGVGLPNVKMLTQNNIPMMIGNDGISTSITTEWLNLYYCMHLKYKNIMSFGLDQLLEMINNAYEYSSELLNCQLGRLSDGYEADLLMLPYSAPTPISEDNVFGHLFFGVFNAFKPRHVWCQGQQLVDNYELTQVKDILYKEAVRSSRELWERIGAATIAREDES